MLLIIICILIIIIGLIFMPSREEQNRKKYKNKEHVGFRYDTKGSVDGLRRDYKTICKLWNEEQEMKKQKK